MLETTPNKTTMVLGTYKSDTGAILDELGNVKSFDFGPRDGGFNLLNTPDELYVSTNQFWNKYNKPWLDNAIAIDRFDIEIYYLYKKGKRRRSQGQEKAVFVLWHKADVDHF